MIIICIILTVLLIVAAIFIVYLVKPLGNKSIYSDSFQRNLKEISQKFILEKENQVKIQTQEIEKEISKIEIVLREKKNSYFNNQDIWNQKLQELEIDYQKRKEEIGQSIQAFSQNIKDKEQEIQKNFLNKKEEINNSLRELNENYKKEVSNYNELIAAAQVEYENESLKLNEQIEEKRREVNTLIEQFKKDEELRKETDFYRIPISNFDKADIEKLKGVAAQLNKPVVLYKYIWETYYKRGFDAMIGRVLGDDKNSIGIYKITNIKNQMTYIGQTKAGFKTRWRTHARRGVKAEEGSANRLYQDMFENGLENYTFQVLEKCNADKLNEREKFYISYYQSDKFGYNSKT